MYGKIIRMVKDRGFAFAEGVDDKVDYFVHMKQVKKESRAFRHFEVGNIVSFDPVVVDGKGPQAHNIMLVLPNDGVVNESATV